MIIKRLLIASLTVLAVLAESWDGFMLEGKNEVTDSTQYEDPNRISLSFRGNFKKIFTFSCITTADFVGSTVCSPMGAFLPLGKLLIGSGVKSPAETELMKAIGESTKRYDVLNMYAQLMQSMTQMLGGVHMDIASKFFLSKKSVKVSDMFDTMAAETFGKARTVEYIDMDDPVGESDKINNWVHVRTHGKIGHIINPSDISLANDNAQMILVNAVYFSGQWETGFSSVMQSTFHAPNGEITLHLMNLEGYFQYGTNPTLDSKVVLVPFQGGTCVFYIFLANTVDGYKVLASKLKNSPKLLKHFTLQRKRVNLTMPKFKYQFATDLIPLYLKCKLNAIFDRNVGLGQIVPDKNMFISRAIHKVGIELNEAGHSKPPKSTKSKTDTVQFLANRPFVFLIAARRDVLFTGIFTGT